MFSSHNDAEQAEDGIPHKFAPEAPFQRHPNVSQVADNLSIKGLEDLGRLDETPFEHDHVDFDARFFEKSPIPHQEVGHDAHGIQEVVVDDLLTHGGDQDSHKHHMPDTPSYEELLWAYQHAGI